VKVLHVIGGVGPGGAETLMYRLVTRRSDVEHEVICLGGRDWYSEGLEQHGIETHYLGMSRLAAVPRALWRLTGLVRKSGADVVQGWMYRSNILASIAARRVGLPSVWSIHCASLEPLSTSARFWAYLSGTLARRLPAAVINCSKRSIKMHDSIGFKGANVVWTPNGYDPTAFSVDQNRREQFRATLGIAPDEFVVGTVSRWHAEKDIPNLLDAIRALATDGKAPRCFLIGHRLDADNSELIDALRERNLQDSVIPLGRRGDVPELLRSFDLLALPSRSESFPNVVPEAMLSGTPCVVTDVGDAPFIVGETGWVAAPRNPRALAEAIGRARDEFERDPSAWGKRRAAARDRIEANFTLDQMAARYEEVWRAAISA